MTQQHLFCFGLGYSAQVLTRRLLDAGWHVSGTCRSQDKAESLRSLGITTYLFNQDQRLTDVSAALDGVTHLLSSVPADADGDPALRAHVDDLGKPAGRIGLYHAADRPDPPA